MASLRKRILIADDDLDVHALVQHALRDDGYQLLTATDGAAALARALTEDPDLIILDVHMPERNGFEVFADLRQNDDTRDIPVVMLTSITARTGIAYDADDMARCTGSRPEAYLEKPIDAEVLRTVVRELIQA
ncbi:response regulator [bacterium]|nr:response regulator [bacterium]